MEQNEIIVRRLYQEAVENGRFAENVRSENRSYIQYTVASKSANLESFSRFFSLVSAAIPDFHLIIENTFTKEDKVMVRYAVYGTLKNDFMGTAGTGQRVELKGLDVFRINSGKVAQRWDSVCQLTCYIR